MNNILYQGKLIGRTAKMLSELTDDEKRQIVVDGIQNHINQKLIDGLKDFHKPEPGSFITIDEVEPKQWQKPEFLSRIFGSKQTMVTCFRKYHKLKRAENREKLKAARRKDAVRKKI